MAIVPAIDSSSVLIIRDDAEGNLETLMVKRHANIKFAGGAYVFPGGKADMSDKNFEDNSSQNDEFSGLYFTSFRELFEETGLLLGGEVENQKLFREKLLNKEITMEEFMQRSGAKFTSGDLIPFAHWVTPDDYPKRFNTRFFLCKAPEGQIPSPDGFEMVETRWVKPLELVAQASEKLMYPTIMNLKRLGRSKNVIEAFSSLKNQKIIMVKPIVIKGKKGEFRVIDKAAGYCEEVGRQVFHPGMKI